MRKEASKWIDRPGMTNMFIKHVQRSEPIRHEYNPNADYAWLKYNSHIGYVPLDIKLPLDIMKEETARAEQHMTPLKVAGEDSRGWVNLGMFAATLEDPYDKSFDKKESTAHWQGLVQELMPETVRWFQQEWPHAQMYRARLLGLLPGGVIGLHNDDCEGLLNVNIAIHHPPECKFYLEHWGVMPFEEGSVFATDVGYNHAVVNPSDRMRLHIVIYQEDDDRFKSLLERSYHNHFGGRA
jgi:hypothetical protein